MQYADFAWWQRERLQGELLERGIAWWKRRLGNELPMLQLPTDRPRGLRRSIRGARQTIELPAQLTGSLRDFSRRNHATLFMTLTATFKALLLRHTGQEDIVIGIPVATRSRAETRGQIGFFVNTVALRTDLSGNPTFVELVARVRESALGAYSHQELPFERLGLPTDGTVAVHDLLGDNRFSWTGALQRLRLDPHDTPFAIWRISPAEGDGQ